MKIGLLGGSFNPPHQGHLHISKLAIQKLGLTQLWWIPTKQNPLKSPRLYEPYAKRLEKCRTLIARHPQIYLKAFDDIYTYNLVNKLTRQYPKAEFFWIMGSDNLAHFHQWRHFKLLLKKVSLAIFSRETSLKKIKQSKSWSFIAKSNYKLFFTPKRDISSSEIRKNTQQ